MERAADVQDLLRRPSQISPRPSWTSSMESDREGRGSACSLAEARRGVTLASGDHTEFIGSHAVLKAAPESAFAVALRSPLRGANRFRHAGSTPRILRRAGKVLAQASRQPPPLTPSVSSDSVAYGACAGRQMLDLACYHLSARLWADGVRLAGAQMSADEVLAHFASPFADVRAAEAAGDPPERIAAVREAHAAEIAACGDWAATYAHQVTAARLAQHLPHPEQRAALHAAVAASLARGLARQDDTSRDAYLHACSAALLSLAMQPDSDTLLAPLATSEVVIWAAAHGLARVAQALARALVADGRASVLLAEEGAALRAAAAAGRASVVRGLLVAAPRDCRSAMLRAGVYGAFTAAAGVGAIAVLEALWALATPYLRAGMMLAEDGRALALAAGVADDGATVMWLLERAPDRAGLLACAGTGALAAAVHARREGALTRLLPFVTCRHDILMVAASLPWVRGVSLIADPALPRPVPHRARMQSHALLLYHCARAIDGAGVAHAWEVLGAVPNTRQLVVSGAVTALTGAGPRARASLACLRANIDWVAWTRAHVDMALAETSRALQASVARYRARAARGEPGSPARLMARSLHLDLLRQAAARGDTDRVAQLIGRSAATVDGLPGQPHGAAVFTHDCTWAALIAGAAGHLDLFGHLDGALGSPAHLGACLLGTCLLRGDAQVMQAAVALEAGRGRLLATFASLRQPLGPAGDPLRDALAGGHACTSGLLVDAVGREGGAMAAAVALADRARAAIAGGGATTELMLTHAQRRTIGRPVESRIDWSTTRTCPLDSLDALLRHFPEAIWQPERAAPLVSQLVEGDMGTMPAAAERALILLRRVAPDRHAELAERLGPRVALLVAARGDVRLLRDARAALPHALAERLFAADVTLQAALRGTNPAFPAHLALALPEARLRSWLTSRRYAAVQPVLAGARAADAHCLLDRLDPDFWRQALDHWRAEGPAATPALAQQLTAFHDADASPVGGCSPVWAGGHQV